MDELEDNLKEIRKYIKDIEKLTKAERVKGTKKSKAKN